MILDPLLLKWMMMKFRSNFDLVDPTLKTHLVRADGQIDELYKIEEAYLTLKAAKDTKWSILYIGSPPGTVEQKKAWVNCHEDWASFSHALATAEAKFHRERNKLEVAMKYIDAAHLSLKVEKMAIERGVGG